MIYVDEMNDYLLGKLRIR